MGVERHDVERCVSERYSRAAGEREEALCCPVQYRGEYLQVIPREILDRDYGCGDPSRHIRRGDAVLDLGSGGGKICYIASQLVGPEGSVVGIDMNEEMLALAESHRRSIGERIGYHNVAFRKGRIQDLAELVAPGSTDVIVSNCVLNLVAFEDRPRLFAGMYAVLREGGRAVISDIVSDVAVPEPMQRDPELWSGCISGAFEEAALLRAFCDAGFGDVRFVQRSGEPWQTLRGIEFRSVTVEAVKGKTSSGCC